MEHGLPAVEHEYSFQVRLPKTPYGERIFSAIRAPVQGVDLHTPGVYHVTVLYLGHEVLDLIPKVRTALGAVPSFAIRFSAAHAASGSVPGYENRKAFYFHIGEKGGGLALRRLREVLQQLVPGSQDQPFIPHVTFGVADLGSDVRVTVVKFEPIYFRVMRIYLRKRGNPDDVEVFSLHIPPSSGRK